MLCVDREYRYRRKIRLIEGNAKCRHLKKFTCKGTLRQVFISLRPRTRFYSHGVNIFPVFRKNMLMIFYRLGHKSSKAHDFLQF